MNKLYLFFILVCWGQLYLFHFSCRLRSRVGRVGENPGNEVVLSSWQRAEFFLKHVYDLRSESERIHHREGGLDMGYQLPLIFYLYPSVQFPFQR